MDGTGNETVCITELDHHNGEVHRIRYEFLRIFLSHALCFSQLEKRLCVFIGFLTCRRIDHLDTGDVCTLFSGDLSHCIGRTDEDRLCKSFLLNDLRRLHGTLLVAFRKNDRLNICLCFCSDLLNQTHKDLPLFPRGALYP